MKKDLIKGIIIGACAAFAITLSTPLSALNTDMGFNLFRIRNSYGTVAEWGESFKFDYGPGENPYSLWYNDTAYIPVDALPFITGSEVAFNGESMTISVSRLRLDRFNGQIIKTQADSNGNVWEYKICDAYDYHNSEVKSKALVVRDNARGFERVYEIMGDYLVTDESIAFLTYLSPSGGYRNGPASGIRVIDFVNHPDTQDGMALDGLGPTSVIVGDAVVYNGKLYFVSNYYRGSLSVNAFNGISEDGTYVVSGGSGGIIYSPDSFSTIYRGYSSDNMLKIIKIESDILYLEKTNQSGEAEMLEISIIPAQ